MYVCMYLRLGKNERNMAPLMLYGLIFFDEHIVCSLDGLYYGQSWVGPKQ